MVRLLLALSFCFLTNTAFATIEQKTVPAPSESEKKQPLSKDFIKKAQSLKPAFDSFERRILSKVKTAQQLCVPDATSVFYPFGGPDVFHALTLFPKAKNYTFMALEPVGSLPLEKVSAQDLSSFMASMFHRGFFITTQMGQKKAAYLGMKPIMLAQLILLGADILSIDEKEKDKLVILFVLNSEEKTLTYYKKNVHGLTTQEASDILKDIPMQACLFKAASYLPHQEPFLGFMEAIAQKCDLVVQDESGFKFSQLQHSFDVSLYSGYVKPYGVEFGHFYQKDLKEAYAQKTELQPDFPKPFCYGYGCGRIITPFIVAIKKSNRSLEN